MFEIFLAFIAGILTIAAPCILLPLPILLGSSIGQTSKTRPLFITFGFILTFAALGITLNAIVQNLGVDPNLLRTGAAILLAIFALFMVWPTPFERLAGHLSTLVNRASKTGQSAGTGNWGGFVMGVVIGIVWAPCAGPILASILTLIAQEKDLAKASGLLIAYAIGAGVPMLAIAYGGQAVTTRVRFIARYATRLQQIFGVILIALALAIYFQYDTKFQAWLIERLPTINSNLEEKILDTTKEEDKNPEADKETTSTMYLKDYGPAPEFTGITDWLGSEPLTMTTLRGKVVLIDFWTYSCINCIRTLPYVTKWYDKYKDKGLVIIGVHTPEFAFEKRAENVERAMRQHDINYPVAQDNDFGTWLAYDNKYWPAKYLVDKDGRIVYKHFGEGEYETTENLIRQLLGMDNQGQGMETYQSYKPLTPEIYFGTGRLNHLEPSSKPSIASKEYTLPTSLNLHQFGLGGTWRFDGEKAVSGGSAHIRLRFQGSKVFMVASSETPQEIIATVGAYPARKITVSNSTLYTIFDSTDYGEHLLDIIIPESGFEAYTFTFGQ